jgi:hypothetical protein
MGVIDPTRIILLGRPRLDTSSRHIVERFEIYQPGPLCADIHKLLWLQCQWH